MDYQWAAYPLFLLILSKISSIRIYIVSKSLHRDFLILVTCQYLCGKQLFYHVSLCGNHRLDLLWISDYDRLSASEHRTNCHLWLCLSRLIDDKSSKHSAFLHIAQKCLRRSKCCGYYRGEQENALEHVRHGFFSVSKLHPLTAIIKHIPGNHQVDDIMPHAF